MKNGDLLTVLCDADENEDDERIEYREYLNILFKFEKRIINPNDMENFMDDLGKSKYKKISKQKNNKDKISNKTLYDLSEVNILQRQFGLQCMKIVFNRITRLNRSRQMRLIEILTKEIGEINKQILERFLIMQKFSDVMDAEDMRESRYEMKRLIAEIKYLTKKIVFLAQFRFVETDDDKNCAVKLDCA